MVDLPTSQGAAVAASLNSENCIFVPTDITKPEDVENALAETKVIFQIGEILIFHNLSFIGKVWSSGRHCKLCWYWGGLQGLQLQQEQGSQLG